MTDEFLGAQDEFDVSDAGIQPLKGALATITDFNVVEKDNGVLHEVTFAVQGLGFPITKGYWFTHENPKAVQAGRGQLKRIAKAATGRTTYTRTSLLGKTLMVDVNEDDAGFAQIRRIAPVAA
jgi:hypothetical protein